MKIVCISDTHGLHEKIVLPEGDMIIHAGDCTNFGSTAQVIEFLEWFSKLDYKYKIFIAGNHDWFFEEREESLVYGVLDLYPEIIYLEDSGVTIENIKIWGSPYQPEFFSWAFNRKRGEEIKEHWNQIPDDTDILITHGPPMRIMDETLTYENVGCEDLLSAVNRIEPKYHIFGHIHNGYGIENIQHITFINASICDEKYNPINKPIIIKI